MEFLPSPDEFAGSTTITFIFSTVAFKLGERLDKITKSKPEAFSAS